MAVTSRFSSRAWFRWPLGASAIARVLAVFALGGAAGFVLVSGHGSSPAARVAVTLGGERFDPSGDEAQAMAEARAIARSYLRQEVTIAAPRDDARETGGARVRSREELGARVDPERLTALVRALRNPGSILLRTHAASAASAKGGALDVPLPLSVDAKRAVSAVVGLKDELDQRSTPARIELDAQRIVPEQPGQRVDVYATLARLDDALATGGARIDAVMTVDPPSRTLAQLGELKYGDVLGYFESRYPTDKKYEAQAADSKRAASRIDGAVILPGETFDFNEAVFAGRAIGDAPAGIGPIAGTLHAAAFFAGLEVVERHPQRRPTTYVPMGLEVAIASPGVTLRLRNPFSFPVVLHETLGGGIVRAEVRGPRRTREVAFVRKIDEVTPFAVREIEDPKIPDGKRVLAQRGVPGFKITRYRIVREGAASVRERMEDRYLPIPQIWRRGTGDADPKFKPREDERPEYLADEHLVITQGPDVVSPRATGSERPERGGGMTEMRVAGKSGVRGWTAHLGPPRAAAERAGEADAPPVD
jgi:vancomycin resistance protein YoaR